MTAFLSCATQWTVSEMSGRRRSLRYADVAAALDMLGVDDRRQVFEGIVVMERAALGVWRNSNEP